MAGSGTVMGFDFGLARIGVAVANTVTAQAHPLTVVRASGRRRWPPLAALIEEWRPIQLVVGVPRPADGPAGGMAVSAARFARSLAGRHGLPVATVDEGYSSVVAGAAPGAPDDALAAALILQQWLDARTNDRDDDESD